jgi:hypothetical protein
MERVRRLKEITVAQPKRRIFVVFFTNKYSFSIHCNSFDVKSIQKSKKPPPVALGW